MTTVPPYGSSPLVAVHTRSPHIPARLVHLVPPLRSSSIAPGLVSSVPLGSLVCSTTRYHSVVTSPHGTGSHLTFRVVGRWYHPFMVHTLSHTLPISVVRLVRTLAYFTWRLGHTPHNLLLSEYFGCEFDLGVCLWLQVYSFESPGLVSRHIGVS